MIKDITDLYDLQSAVNVLENPSLTAQITDLIGMPMEKALKYLPERWNDKLTEITHTALSKALDVSIRSINDTGTENPKNFMHKVLSGTSGALGGAFGLAALSVELPVSTTIILRSIADIARSSGEDLHSYETRLSCLEVFALGGKTDKDDAMDSAYFLVRVGLSQYIAEAAKVFAQRGLAGEGASVVLNFISKIAARFGIQVSEKAAAQAVPIIGAAGGAIVNVIFMDHFQKIAGGHFTVRRLERKYGKEVVRAEYEKILRGLRTELH
ncbi:MAG: EcsC family protein [Ignavibacteriaceae bacterium]|nr:EcsC family protein [Ignavibacteriaceae bacterium]